MKQIIITQETLPLDLPFQSNNINTQEIVSLGLLLSNKESNVKIEITCVNEHCPEFKIIPLQASIIPNIFMKKKSLKEIKPLEYVSNDTGKTRHYPPATQE
jgi:hypothetical protein